MGFDPLRAQALSQTDPDLSRRILARFKRLVAHPSPSGFGGIHYQDYDLRGAICCTAEEAMLLYWLVRLIDPLHPLEIGSYVGWSTAHLLAASRRPVQCVDSFTEVSADAAGDASGFLAPMRFSGEARMVENLTRCELRHFHLTVGASPACLERIAPLAGWDFVFLDGEHSGGQPMRDVDGLSEHLSDDGVIVLHDVWLPDVRKALERLKSLGYSAFTFATANLLTVTWRQAPLHAAGWPGSLSRLETLYACPDERLRERVRALGL